MTTVFILLSAFALTMLISFIRIRLFGQTIKTGEDNESIAKAMLLISIVGVIVYNFRPDWPELENAFWLCFIPGLLIFFLIMSASEDEKKKNITSANDTSITEVSRSKLSTPKLSSGQSTQEVTVPHPEKCLDKTMLDFISETPGYKLEAIFEAYATQGIAVKQLYLDACYDKIKNSAVYLQHYYDLANIEEAPVDDAYQWMAKSHHELKLRRAEYEYSIYFEVTGVHVPVRKNFIRNHCNVSDKVSLVPEPSNKYDKNAIKVRCNDKLIGYIKLDETDLVKGIIENSHYAYISKIDDVSGFIDVEIKIEY